MPEVSIITPVYNNEPFLAEAIESVLSQQQCVDWELILVDDGSTDGSVATALEFCDRDPRIRLLLHEGHCNRGSSASRNLGISDARADLIAFLDADDTWIPHKLRSQIDILKAHPEAVMIFSAAERWHSWNGASKEQDFRVPSIIPGFGSDALIPPPALLRAYLADEAATPCTCTVIVRRDEVVRAGAFEDNFRGLYDDQVFYAKICLRRPVFVSSQCTARYRQHENSCCASARRLDTAQHGRTKFLEWLQGYASEDKSLFTLARNISA